MSEAFFTAFPSRNGSTFGAATAAALTDWLKEHA